MRGRSGRTAGRTTGKGGGKGRGEREGGFAPFGIYIKAAATSGQSIGLRYV